MIYKIEMFAAKCDNCKKEYYEDTDFSCMGDAGLVREEMMESDWHETDDEKHYCEKCWLYNDNDEVVIDISRFKEN